MLKLTDSFNKEMKKNYNLYLMILPGFLGFIIFHYFPIFGVSIAFKDYDLVMGFADSPFVGLKHFISFFRDLYFFRVLKNTLLLGIYSLLWGFWPPIVMALLLNEITSIRAKKFFQTVSYLPHFIAIVVIVGIMMQLLSVDGIVNHLRIQKISFFSNSKYFRTLFISSNIWKEVGWGSVLYLATITGIGAQLYEASYIDGANRFQRMWHVTLPGILPTIIIILILNTSRIINVSFEKVYLMQNPVIYEVADVMQTYVYRRGVINRNFSYATAVGLFNSVVSFAILYMANKFSRMIKQNSLW